MPETDEPKDPEDKKLVVDEDWKSRAQAEKQALEMKRQQEQAEQAAGDKTAGTAADTAAAATTAAAGNAGEADQGEPFPPDDEEKFPLPPASFATLVYLS